MLRRILQRRQVDARPDGVDALARLHDDADIPRYPPFARGLPSVRAPEVLKTQETLIRELRHTVGLSPEVFDAVIWPVIERLAQWTHLLPASEAHHHRMTGGLLRHSLEVGLYAARMAEGTVFVPMGTPLQRRTEEPRWHTAVATAGLLHDIGKPVSDVTVIDDHGRTWDPYTAMLEAWLMDTAVNRYFLRWRPQRGRRHEQFAGLVADRVFPSTTASWLAEGGTEIVEHVLSTITASATDSRVARLVADADHSSVERDLRANNVPEAPSLGVPVDRHILDAMRRLLADGAWRVNEPGARLWVLKEGVFVVWERGCEDILARLRQDRIPGIPRHPDALADALLERGHAHMRSVDESTQYRYWLIQPACVGDGTVVLKALRLASPRLLWNDTEPPPPAAAHVGDPSERSSTSAAEEQGEPGAAAPPKTGPAANPGRPSGTAAERSQPVMPANRPSDPAAESPATEAADDSIGTRLTVIRRAEPEQASGSETGDSPAATEAATTQAEPDTGNHGEPDPASPPEERADCAAATPTDQTSAEAAAADTDAPAPDTGANGDPSADALEALRNDSDAGAVLAAMITAITDGETRVQDCFRRTRAGLLLRYPEPVRPYVDKPNHFLQSLKARGAIEPDPDNPLRPVRQLDGVSGLVLTRDMAQRIEGLIDVDSATAASAPTEEVGEGTEQRAQKTPAAPATARGDAQDTDQPKRRPRRGPGQPSSPELVTQQADAALERLVSTVRDSGDELPGDLKPDASTAGWLAVPLDAAARFTGMTKTRMRLSIASDSPLEVRSGYLFIPDPRS